MSCSFLSLKAQTTDEQLAQQYYQNREFDKALVYYEKLAKKSNPDFYYKNLLECYLETEQYKDAERLVKNMVKRTAYSFTYRVDLGYVYRKSSENDKAEKEYKSIIKDLEKNPGAVYEVSNAFSQRKEDNFALESFYVARKFKQLDYGFQFEIANLLSSKGDLKGSIQEYLDVLLVNEQYLTQVQNSLFRFYHNADEEKSILIKNEILKRIQSLPDKTIFSELLLWISLQQNDFYGSLIQAKSLDRRLNEDGSRVYQIAEIAAKNEDFGVAADAYQYLIDKGKNNYYYEKSVIGGINMQFALLKKELKPSAESVKKLNEQFASALQNLGKYPSTIPLIRQWASLKAFYLNNFEEAEQMLNECIEMPRASSQDIANCKIELADIYVLINEVWDAALLYGQVDKQFKHDPIGDLAKYKNARLSFYLGELKWSKAQLDVLKGSTSKLIANDAMKLSMLISDNSTIDTNSVPLQLYAKAELCMYQNNFEYAFRFLDTLKKFFPAHTIIDEAMFLESQIYLKTQSYSKATELLEKILNQWKEDILADDACFNLAEINELYLGNIEKAKLYYEQIITDFTASIFVVEARKRYRKLRGDQIN
jgi:tetratricopeptide (TPR) repeat protein